MGTTTLAVNIAVSLALAGRRVLLVDADFRGADATTLCQVEPRYSIADVLSGRHTVHEVLERGPAGIQVLPGRWAAGLPVECPPAGQERLLRELDRLGAHAELIVIDAGSGICPEVQRFWQSSHGVLLVTTPDPVSVMDTYAALKVAHESGATTDVRTLVNMAPDAERAADVHGRLSRTAQRFLSLPLHSAGHLATDAGIASAGAVDRPFRLEAAGSATAGELDALAESLVEWLPEASRARSTAAADRTSRVTSMAS